MSTVRAWSTPLPSFLHGVSLCPSQQPWGQENLFVFKLESTTLLSVVPCSSSCLYPKAISHLICPLYSSILVLINPSVNHLSSQCKWLRKLYCIFIPTKLDYPFSYLMGCLTNSPKEPEMINSCFHVKISAKGECWLLNGLRGRLRPIYPSVDINCSH